jgi:hypothetical protein
MRANRILLGCLFAMVAVARPAAACAQESFDTTADRSGWHAVEAWAGYSAHSLNAGFLGDRSGLHFAEGVVRFSHRLSTRPSRTIDFIVDVVPVALMSPPLIDDNDPSTGFRVINVVDAPCDILTGCPSSTACRHVSCAFPSGSAHGAGFSPLGVTAIFRRDHMLQWRLGATGGALVFDRRVPTTVSTAANFTASVEAGAQLVSRNGCGLVLLYRFHHISNAGFGYDNSGLASQLIAIGARWRQ